MTDFLSRLRKVQQSLSELQCDSLIVEDPIDLFYLSGMQLSRGILVIYAQECCLFVDSRYLEICKENAPCTVLSDEILDEWLASEKLMASFHIGFDSSKTSYSRYFFWDKKFEALAQKLDLQNQAILVPLEAPITALRSIKDPCEIALLQKAADLGSLGYDFIVENLRVGITEIELAIELDIFWKRKGSQGFAFDPIIAFGPSSSMPHYTARDHPLSLGDIVLIDIGVKLNHYHSDMTRTVFFGKPDKKLVEIYDIAHEAQVRALELCRPGIPLVELDRAAREYISSMGYGKAFSHSLGHGVGLEIHEFPFIRKANTADVLQEGMVITIEPGIYLPKVGGVRLEDTVAITKDGYENLTKREISPPEDIRERRGVKVD